MNENQDPTAAGTSPALNPSVKDPRPRGRDLTEVIDQILEVVPSDRLNLHARLKSVKDGAMYAAPEMMKQHWSRAQTILASELGNPTKFKDEWMLRVYQIFTDTVVDEIHRRGG